MTWHSEHGAALYVDGMLGASVPTSSALSSPDSYPEFQLGKPNSVANYFADFLIDEFYIYETLFTAAEVRNLYRSYGRYIDSLEIIHITSHQLSWSQREGTTNSLCPISIFFNYTY